MTFARSQTAGFFRWYLERSKGNGCEVTFADEGKLVAELQFQEPSERSEELKNGEHLSIGLVPVRRLYGQPGPRFR